MDNSEKLKHISRSITSKSQLISDYWMQKDKAPEAADAQKWGKRPSGLQMMMKKGDKNVK